MRAIHFIIGIMATLGLNVSAVALRIYTPVHRNMTIVSLKPDWSIDRRTKAEFLQNYTTYGNIQQPGGGNNFFAVTGLMEWENEKFDVRRAFWVTTADFVGDPYKVDPYSPAQGPIRDWLKCTVQSMQRLKKDVYLYLVPEDMPDEVSWADTAKKEKLDDHWLKCYPPTGKRIGDYFKMPDGST